MADEKQKIVDKKQVPTGVKVISVWYYILASYLVIIGVFFMVVVYMYPGWRG